MSLTVHDAACTGCGLCVLSCPEDAVDTLPLFVARIDERSCTECLVCLDYCPHDALAEE